ncbi:MAG: hypothetical protein ACQCN4_12185 [Candidatus Bathyarchaeia archaeon]
MVLLKLEMPVMLDETLKVIIAAVDSPAASEVPPLFQLTVMYVPAPDGLQLLADKPKVIAPVPVFLT